MSIDHCAFVILLYLQFSTQKQYQISFYSSFIYIKIEIEVNVKKPGILSVIAASDFSNTNVFINLVAKKKNKLVAMEKNFMLDDVETNEEHLGEQSDFGVARNHDAWDFLSALEVAHLEAGLYKIQIAVPKGSWFA